MEIDDDVVMRIRELYNGDAGAQKLFDWIATLERGAAETTLDNFMSKLGVKRKEAIRLAKILDSAGCGHFRIGRQGRESRFIWSYNRGRLGKVAKGDIGGPSGANSRIDSGNGDGASVVAEMNGGFLSISEAKKRLSISLGVDESAIEINIRG